MKFTTLEHLEVFTRYYMPSGRVWDNKNVIGAGIRNLAYGFCDEFSRGEIEVFEFVQEMMPDTTDAYIGRWEQAVGIPDDCYIVAVTLQERRDNVQTKLASLGLQTKADFENFAASIGIGITARSGIDHVVVGDGGYGNDLPALNITADFANVWEARQTLVITILTDSLSFTYDFDFPFSSPAEILMRCVFTHAKPANADILFVLLP